MQTGQPLSSFERSLADEAATRRFAAEIAAALRPGDLVTLSGELGAGKTAFARAFIRHLAGDATLEVPSPTFTLLQTYTLPRYVVGHVDLYRIGDSSELDELGLDDLGPEAVILMEWPDRAEGRLAPDRFDLAFALAPEHGTNARTVRVTGYGAAAARVARLEQGDRFLADAGWGGADRRFLQGDASARAYERVALADRRAVLMNAPRRPDGPPLRGGRSYSAIAHLAEDVQPFVAIARALHDRGFSAPVIHAADLDAGFILLEDLGNDFIVDGDPPGPVEERYAAAVDVLLALHAETLPETLPVAPDREHRIPPYDRDALLIELELLLDWYLPYHAHAAPPEACEAFAALWDEALRPVLAAPTTWVLRDYHSPNLLWLPHREGIARIGLLDFQDAVLGSEAYDVVSLLQDARVDVSERLEVALLGRYVKGRRARDPAFDAAGFATLYATLGAQRASKILGIFARLHRRDGKPQYLRHLPRVWGYLARSLAHPALQPLRTWYDRHVPPANVA